MTSRDGIKLILSFPVSYLVGLGDRHVQNILIDNNTAEFIHIDLGEYITHPNSSLEGHMLQS